MEARTEEMRAEAQPPSRRASSCAMWLQLVQRRAVTLLAAAAAKKHLFLCFVVNHRFHPHRPSEDHRPNQPHYSNFHGQGTNNWPKEENPAADCSV